MLTAALQGQDAVVNTLGMGIDASLHNLIIDAAIAASVKRFIPSEFAFDIMNPLAAELPVFENKLKVMKHLVERTWMSKMTYTYVVNSIFLDWSLEHRLILDISNRKPTIFGSGNELFSTSMTTTAAQTVVGILKHYEETKNRAVYIQDAVISQNKLLAIAKKHMPGGDWEPQYVDLEEVKAESDEKFAGGSYGVYTLYSYLFVALFKQGYGGRLEKTDNELFGIREMSEEEVEEVVKKHLPKII